MNRTRVCLLALVGTIAGFGQSLKLTATIPFQFSIGRGTAFPAGTYDLAYSPQSRAVTLSRGSQRAATLRVLTTMAGQARFGDVALVFDESGSLPVISEIWLPGSDGLLLHATKGSHQHRSVQAVVAGRAGGSGKEIFASTCARCHGPKGTGNEAADRFFNTGIPRLASEAVQSKSDSELKEIITQGRRNMDPVREGQGGVQHLLQPEAVDAVIAYIRTLRQ